jgi:hypothetical protein
MTLQDDSNSGLEPDGAGQRVFVSQTIFASAKPLPPRRPRAKAVRGHNDVDIHCLDAAQNSPLSDAPQAERPVKAVRRKGGGIGQEADVIHANIADTEPSALSGGGAGQSSADLLEAGAGPEEDIAFDPVDLNSVKRLSAAERKAMKARVAEMDLPTVIDGLISLHREHRALQRAEGDMTRRVKADQKWVAHARYVRDGIPIPQGKMPEESAEDIALVKNLRHRLYTAGGLLKTLKKQVEAEQLFLVQRLPVYDWVLGVKGFGLASLAAVIGEAGDIGKYDNPAKLWKRMGLAVIDGERQRKVANNPELAEKHGYRPQRRAEMYVIGGNLLRRKSPGLYELYLSRKEYELTGRADPVPYPVLAHKRALRYIEKRLLKQLWQAWRRATGRSTGEDEAPALAAE